MAKPGTIPPGLEQHLRLAGIVVGNRELMGTSLVHRSYANERWEDPCESNERLEFLGDAVLNFLTARYLYTTFPDKGEGELTALRAAVVRESTLARFARTLQLGVALRLGRGVEQHGGRDRDSLLCDAFEAVVGAVFQDGGPEAAERFWCPFLETEVGRIVEHGLVVDERTRLQERIQGERNQTPQYRTVRSEGPDHDRRFTVEVWAGDERLGAGEGSSKQAAAQAAARAALVELDRPATSSS
jgi:ribonuclease III